MSWNVDECLLFLKDAVIDLSSKEIKMLISYLKIQEKLKEMREKFK